MSLSPLQKGFNGILNYHVYKFVLDLDLHHAGQLGSNRLDHPLDVDLVIWAPTLDLVNDHFDGDKSACNADNGATVDRQRAGIDPQILSRVDLVQKIQNVARIRRHHIGQPI